MINSTNFASRSLCRDVACRVSWNVNYHEPRKPHERKCLILNIFSLRGSRGSRLKIINNKINHRNHRSDN